MPKRKRKDDGKPPGKQYQILLKYSELPTDVQELKNGHILHQVEVHPSKADVLRLFRDNFNIVITNNILQSLLTRSVKRYVNLVREADAKRFRDICDAAFTNYDVVVPEIVPAESVSRSIDFGSCSNVEGTSETQPPVTPLPSVPKSPEGTSGTHPPVTPLPSVPKSPVSASSIRSLKRKGLLTPLKKKILERGEKLKREVHTLKNKVTVVRTQLSSKKYKQNRYLQRQIARLYEQLRIKREKLEKKEKELSEIKDKAVEEQVQKELANAKRTIRRLKQQHKGCPSKIRFRKIKNENRDLKRQLKEKKNVETVIDDRVLQLEDELNILMQDEAVDCRDGRTVSSKARLLVYFMLDCGVPTKRVPLLIERVGWWFGVKLSNIPQRATVENISRELGIVCDLMVAEMALKSADLTIGFDATTQDGTHVNEIHLSTTDKESKVMALDELPGGTAVDYSSHITRSVKHLADVHSLILDSNSEVIEKKIQANIRNSMTDRCPVNNATMRIIEEKWDCNINQLNCNLHPLETITKECKKTLKKHEKEQSYAGGQCYGNDCLAGNLVLKSNQLRYKDGTGDPRMFKTRLQKANLPNNLLPRFRGSRMHITHTISRVLLEHQVFFTELFSDKQLKSTQLRSAVHSDYSRTEVKMELQVLGVMGRAVTGPWMTRFYDDEDSNLHHFEAFNLIKEALVTIENWAENPLSVFSNNVDCFGSDIVMEDCLRTLPEHKELFTSMLGDCFKGTVDVLKRQFSTYFTLNIDEKLMTETKSAKVHNIYAEQIMGMFSAIKSLKTNATVDFISCAIRARKNHAVDYLMGMKEESRDRIISKARGCALKARVVKRKSKKELEDEILLRYQLKAQKGVDLDHKRLVNQLKKGTKKTDDFPEHKETMDNIIEGRLIGETIAHTFFDEEDQKAVMYLGRVESWNKKNQKYVIGYWKPFESEAYEEDAVDDNQSAHGLAVDYYFGDLIIE